MVIWLIGMAGSGKTTIGRQLFKEVRSQHPNTVYIDGDDIREIFKTNQLNKDYSSYARKKNADRISAMCHWLDQQGHNVICSILSVFEASREWNRVNYTEYFEIYIKTNFETLCQRDQKGLYSGAQAGKIKDVVGFDIPFEEPLHPNYILENNIQKDHHYEDVSTIYSIIQKKLK